MYPTYLVAKISLDKHSSVYPTYLPTDLEKVASCACGHFAGNHAILRTFWVKYSVRIEEEDVTVENWGWIKEIYNRFIKVWTSIADLPTSQMFVQTFFLQKVWLRITLPTYDLDIMSKFSYLFFGSLLFGKTYCYLVVVLSGKFLKQLSLIQFNWTISHFEAEIP